MAVDSVYNSTTISYEPSSTPRRRPLITLSELVSPSHNRSKALHFSLLIGAIIFVLVGLVITIVYSFSEEETDITSDIEDLHKRANNRTAQWAFITLGLSMTVIGVIVIYFLSRGENFPKWCCASSARNALRKAKPRLSSGVQMNGGGNLLVGDGHTMGTQYDPVPDIAYHPSADGCSDSVTEEKAQLMAHEAKEGRRWNSQQKPSTSYFNRPMRPPRRKDLVKQSSLDEQRKEALRQEVEAARKILECPPTPTPSFEFYCPSLNSVIPSDTEDPISPKNAGASNTAASHYKPRHFASHGYGPGSSSRGPCNNNVPLASTEDISPSLRSSFNSVMMYAASQNLSDYTDNDFEGFHSERESPEYDGDGESEVDSRLNASFVLPQRRSISGQYPYYNPHGHSQGGGGRSSRHRSSSHSPTLSVRSALL